MVIPDINTARLARVLNWSQEDARASLEAVVSESEGMTVSAAETVIQVLNQAVVEMSPGMAAVVAVSAEYRRAAS